MTCRGTARSAQRHHLLAEQFRVRRVPRAKDGFASRRLANPAFWLDFQRPTTNAEKPAWAERLLESAVRFMPDFRPAIVDTDMFTPRTIKKFTGHINGCVYGSADKIISGRTHLENVFLCGNDQGLLGIVGT